MKILIALAAALLLGFTAGYSVVSKQKNAALAAAQKEFGAERERLEQELARALQNEPQVQYVNVPSAAAAPARMSPEEIILQLRALRPSGRNQGPAMRQVLLHLENLVEWGPAAVPAIRGFLLLNEDFDYNVAGLGGRAGAADRQGWAATPRLGQLTDFVFPPSLRFGLFDALARIGGPEAQALLAHVLGTTGRGVEVAYLARVLEEWAPGQYRDIALEAAKDLLANPLPMDDPNRLDERSEEYLWSLLVMYRDGTFATTAQGMLVNSEGRLNRNAFNYLNAVLEENAIPMLHDAYASGRLSEPRDRLQIANQLLEHVGRNSHSDLLLRQIVTDESIDERMRPLAIYRLAGTPGQQQPDPAVLQPRLQALQALRPTIQDPRLLEAIDLTSTSIQNQLNGQPAENPMNLMLRGFGNRQPGGEAPDAGQGRGGRRGGGGN